MELFFKMLFFTLLSYWCWILLSQAQPWIFLDGVNLLVHEAGHAVFAFLGEFMMVLGGSLTQCLMPFGIGIYFVMTKQWYAALFSLFWLGDSVINVSVYIKDAQSMVLPLVGGDGVIHDWNWLLTRTSLLPFSNAIGTTVYVCGVLCVLSSLAGYMYDMLHLLTLQRD